MASTVYQCNLWQEMRIYTAGDELRAFAKLTFTSIKVFLDDRVEGPLSLEAPSNVLAELVVWYVAADS